MAGTRAVEFVVATANFGGAARGVPARGGGDGDRTEAIVDFIRFASGVPAIDALPLVVGLQEMIRLLTVQEPGSPVDYPQGIAQRLLAHGGGVDWYYVPTVTMFHYPLEKKWRGRWDEGIDDMEQGMFTCAQRGASLFAPQPDSRGDERFKGRRLDLPLRDGQYYRGTRDTEPRVATAHRVRIGSEPGAQFVFVNLHLATLKAEDADTSKRAPSDAQARTIRRATPDAIGLRRLQLDVIGNFIREEVYNELRLPVIVAGDFNASLEAPELTAFMRDSHLRPVFDPDPARCWDCGSEKPRGRTPIEFFTYHNRKEILDKTREDVMALIGPGYANDFAISADECCARCHAPFFTHKRNFGLIDNILYTDAQAPGLRNSGQALRWCLDPDLGDRARGIRLDTYFSDHLPLWCKFRIHPA